MVSELVRPATVNFLDSMMRERTPVRFGELTVSKTSRLVGRTLAEQEAAIRAFDDGGGDFGDLHFPTVRPA